MRSITQEQLLEYGGCITDSCITNSPLYKGDKETYTLGVYNRNGNLVGNFYGTAWDIINQYNDEGWLDHKGFYEDHGCPILGDYSENGDWVQGYAEGEATDKEIININTDYGKGYKKKFIVVKK